MPMVSVAQLLAKAKEGKYAVGAFNCNNMEIVQAIVAAAEAERAPVIIQASQGAIKYAGIEYIVALARLAADQSTIPVALHLDHGTSFEQCVKCIASGFTSVMIDGSKHPLDENIALTNRVLAVARAVGVSVEGELGKIGGTEDDIHVDERDVFFTEPAEALRFVQETGVDSFAPAFGTAHGQYKGRPELDFARLEKIYSLVPETPIVMHGSSGVPDEDIRRAIERGGVRKINIDTNIREQFVAGVKEAIAKNPAEIDPRKLLGPAKEKMIEIIREKIRLFGSSGQA
ncbi:class II fructose-1,6-bisphosphate aldolase [Heliophilum fasciatum]|uniref:Fructose-bisphosphate aldolase class II n=1 Tax=Heliophilum fasciatum TaxID=35700 RepID=A0A4R2RMJ5_9FIRM|nr:class II fructose-1,6-bisphosphate aldolase [Heliophilum fasciatum]MCW2277499.1 fructose-bisphosphate aldolase class II [Heliophilum fasciatum]TCP65210.1 fructose-bisphosphate aldolase class II [Heliophilum fasciatum]